MDRSGQVKHAVVVPIAGYYAACVIDKGDLLTWIELPVTGPEPDGDDTRCCVAEQRYIGIAVAVEIAAGDTRGWISSGIYRSPNKSLGGRQNGGRNQEANN
jgi:hypothetical protein